MVSRQEAISDNPGESYRSVVQNGSSESGELWLDPGYAMKVGSIGLADGLLVAEREREESKMTPKTVAYVTGRIE